MHTYGKYRVYGRRTVRDKYSKNKRKTSITGTGKLLICCMIFLLCFGIKMLAPGYAEIASEKLMPVLDANKDYKETFKEIGESIGEGEGMSEALMTFAGFTSREEDQKDLNQTPDRTSMETAVPVIGELTSGYGKRVHPITQLETFHYGIDIAAEEGEPIAAYADGTVISAGESSSLGKFVLIEHDGGIQTQYAHCSELLVKSGDEVSCGQIIAKVGETGLADGAHLHFEVMKDGDYVDPLDYLS